MTLAQYQLAQASTLKVYHAQRLDDRPAFRGWSASMRLVFLLAMMLCVEFFHMDGTYTFSQGAISSWADRRALDYTTLGPPH